MEKRYALRDDPWELLHGLGLPRCDGHVSVTAKDNRPFVKAVPYRFRAGIPWRDLPPRFGNWHRVYVRFNHWSKQGVWLKIFTFNSHSSKSSNRVSHTGTEKPQPGDQHLKTRISLGE